MFNSIILLMARSKHDPLFLSISSITVKVATLIELNVPVVFICDIRQQTK